MTELLDKLEVIFEQEDMDILIRDLINLFERGDLVGKLDQSTDSDKQAIQSTLNKILERVNNYQIKIINQQNRAKTKIKELEKITEACLAYTKVKTKQRE